MPVNYFKFTCETVKEKDHNSALTKVAIRIATTYYDAILRQEKPFDFIESITPADTNDNEYIIQMENHPQDNFEITEDNINWSNGFTVDMEVDTCNPVDIFYNILEKARLTSLYLHGIKLKKLCKAIDPNEQVVKCQIQGSHIDRPKEDLSLDFNLTVKLVIYEAFTVVLNCKKSTGKLYIEQSSFLNQEQIDCLNSFLPHLEYKVNEIKVLLQLLCIEYFSNQFDRKMKEFCLHVVKTDRMVFHFSIKKAKCMHINRKKNDIWNIVAKDLRLESTTVSKMKNLFYGNNLYVFLSPFDYLITIPIFNPASIIKTDKTYNFMTVEIPCDIFPVHGQKKTPLPKQLNDVIIKFFCGKITDHEDAQLDETETLVNFDQDLNLNPEEQLNVIDDKKNTIHQLAREIVIYYKRNDQLKCLQTLMSKISDNITITDDKRRLILKGLNFDQHNEFKLLQMFQTIFASTKLEIRND